MIPPDRTGTILAGKYELVRVAGQGGMAQVWRARIRGDSSARFVAVKRMLVDADRAEQFEELFLEEARVGLQLRHPNVVGVIDFGASKDEGYFLVMEWVEGVDLLDFMRAFHTDRRHLPWQAVAAIGHGAAMGLMGAHERKGADGSRQPVIHRDLTPGNILVGIDGSVKITDFGLARAMDRGNMTMPNTIKGKLSYTAPEVAEGQRATERSDIFSLGVTLWETLAGCKLFVGKTNFEVIEAILSWNVRRLAPLRPDISANLVETVERAIARHPADRFASARLMASALHNVLRADPVSAARLGATVMAARDRLAELDGLANEEPSVIEVVVGAEPAAPRARPAADPAVRPPPPAEPAARKRPPVTPKRPPVAPKRAAAAAPPTPERPAAAPLRPPAEAKKSTPGVAPAPRRPPTAPPIALPAAPVIREAQVPHETLELSFSDLFAARIDGPSDLHTTPAADRIASRSSQSELVLDHPSSWNLDTVALTQDPKGGGGTGGA